MFNKHCLHYLYVHKLNIRYPFKISIHRNMVYMEFMHEDVWDKINLYVPEITFISNIMAYMGDGMLKKMLSLDEDNFGHYDGNKIFEIMHTTEKVDYILDLGKSLQRIFSEADPEASVFFSNATDFLFSFSPVEYSKYHALDNLAYNYYVKLLSQALDGYGRFYVDGNINNRIRIVSKKPVNLEDACGINRPEYNFKTFAYVNYRNFKQEILQRLIHILQMDKALYDSNTINNLQIDKLIALTENEIGRLMR
jgi:hypothetical protein